MKVLSLSANYNGAGTHGLDTIDAVRQIQFQEIAPCPFKEEDFLLVIVRQRTDWRAFDC